MMVKFNVLLKSLNHDNFIIIVYYNCVYAKQNYYLNM